MARIAGGLPIVVIGAAAPFVLAGLPAPDDALALLAMVA